MKSNEEQRKNPSHSAKNPQNSEVQELRIGKRALVFAASVLLLLILLTGLLTRFIPSGSYERVIIDGRSQVVPGSYHQIPSPEIPAWRWFTASIEVLWGPDSTMIISIILFMCLIAGAISIMSSGGLLSYLIDSIVYRFRNSRYTMEAVIILIFMLFGSLLGSMEEVVVLVPLMTALAVTMGWDILTGLGLSLGAIAFGFAAALTNPFTIGVAQRLADIPVFSGLPYRLFIFIVIYTVYTLYIISSSRKREHPKAVQIVSEMPARTVPTADTADNSLQHDSNQILQDEKRKKRGLFWFAAWLGIMLALILSASIIPLISQYVLPIVVLCFLFGGIGAGILSGMAGEWLGKSFAKGILGVAPGIILVLMASSITHILRTAEILDSILFLASRNITDMGPIGAGISVFLLVMMLNFFISSGSAKAFLIIPIIAPLADLTGLSRQTAVLAYVFGDGFSNVLYPSNALLLICLAITGIGFGKWFLWIWKIEALVFLLCILFIILAVLIGY